MPYFLLYFYYKLIITMGNFIQNIGKIMQLSLYIVISFLMLLLLIPVQGMINTLKYLSNKLS